MIRCLVRSSRSADKWTVFEGCTALAFRYGLAPDPDLLDQIRAHGFQPPEVGAVALHRTLSELSSSEDWVKPR